MSQLKLIKVTELHAETMTPRQKTLALLTLVVALVLEIVDLTIVNTALPAIQADFGADAQAAQWIIAGYSLAFALLLMAGGRMGDSFGYRRMFIWGVAGFTLSSVLCGMAQSGSQLVLARLLQGATGAIMAPQFMALMQVLFHPLERVSKLAMFGVIGGLAAIIGPIIGGMLIAADAFGLGWRLIFLINLPIGALAVISGWLYLPETRSGRPAGYDIGGIVIFGLAIAALLWPLVRGQHGAPGVWEWALLAAAAPLGWLGWQHVTRRVADGRAALFDPSLFAIRPFRIGLAISICFSAANAGFLMCFAFALQAERGQTPLVTGLLHMPFGFGAMFGIAVLGRRLLPRVGRWILVAGALFMALFASLVLVGVGELALSWTTLTPLLVLAGAGMGMISGCVPPVTVAQVDKDHAGAASGLLKTSQQVGSALGIALIGSAYFAGAGYADHPGSTMALVPLVPLLLLCAVLAARLPGTIFARPAVQH
ncbi:MAG: MFS transporter [Novosphingobium sp.]